MVEINSAILQQQSIFKSAKNLNSDARSIKYYIEEISTAKEIGEIAKKQIGTMPYRIAMAGYSAPPKGYEDITKSFLKMLDMELGVRSTAFVTSPTDAKGSIGAITTEISGLNPQKIFYVTAERYTDYIKSIEPYNTNMSKYLSIPKYALPSADEYSKATAEASNIFLAIGGRNVTVNDFVNAIKKGNKAIILDNTNLDVPAWGEETSRVENASKYLTEQINAFMNSDKLPYPEVGEFTKEFMEENKDKLKKLTHIITLKETEPLNLLMSVKDAVHFIKYQ